MASTGPTRVARRLRPLLVSGATVLIVLVAAVTAQFMPAPPAPDLAPLLSSSPASPSTLSPQSPPPLSESIRLALGRGDSAWVLEVASRASAEERSAPDRAASEAIYAWLNAQPHGSLDDILRAKLHIAALLLDPSLQRPYEDLLNDASSLAQIDPALLQHVHRAWTSHQLQNPELAPVGHLLELFRFPLCAYEVLGQWELAEESSGVRIAALDRDALYYSVAYATAKDGRNLHARWYRLSTTDGNAKPSLLGDFGAQGQIALSPDRPKVAYYAGPEPPSALGQSDHSGQIFLGDLATGKSALVTDVPALRGNMAWSRDGARLAVATEQGIVVVDLHGGRTSLLVPLELPPEDALGRPLFLQIVGWSLGDAEILYQLPGGDDYGSSPVNAVSIKDGRVREALGPGPDFTHLSEAVLSPDGQWLICARMRVWYSDLMLVSTSKESQTPPRTLVSGGFSAFPVGWSTNGGYVVLRLYAGVEQTHIINLATGARARLGDALYLAQWNQVFLADDGTGYHVPWMKGHTIAKVRLTLP